MTIITEKKKNFRPIKNSCLTKIDGKSLGQLSKEMSEAKSDDEVLEIARQIISADRKNTRITGNEFNIGVIMKYIKDNTSKGDYISFASISNEVYGRNDLHCYINHDYATVNAIPVVFARLEEEGYIKRKKMARTDKYGRNGKILYKYIYVVMR